MRLEIFEPKEVLEEEEPIRLRLKQFGHRIDLEVVDENGDMIDTILSVENNGTIEMWADIAPSLGFATEEVDGDVYVEVVHEESCR